MTQHPNAAGYLLTCPASGHTLAHVNVQPGTGWPDDPDQLDAGTCHIAPELDRQLASLVASHAETPPVPLADLAGLLGIPATTVRDLVRAGLPLRQLAAEPAADLAELGRWTHTARSGPGRRPATWAWRCWPCLRSRASHASATGALPVSWLVRLAATYLAAPTPPAGRQLAPVTATRDGVGQAIRDRVADPDRLARAVAYLTPRTQLASEPTTSQLAGALASHEPHNPDAPRRITGPARPRRP